MNSNTDPTPSTTNEAPLRKQRKQRRLVKTVLGGTHNAGKVGRLGSQLYITGQDGRLQRCTMNEGGEVSLLARPHLNKKQRVKAARQARQDATAAILRDGKEGVAP